MYCSNNCFDKMKTKILHYRSSANNYYFYYICVLGVSILPLSTILIFYFGIVSDSVVFVFLFFFHFVGKHVDKINLDI